MNYIYLFFSGVMAYITLEIQLFIQVSNLKFNFLRVFEKKMKYLIVVEIKR